MTEKETDEGWATRHRVHYGDAVHMPFVADNSVALVATSPPYPMIAMWDEMFSRSSPPVAEALKRNDGPLAFDLMHRSLLPVWKEAWRVLVPGGFACINIGDAVRTVNGDFSLYPNHARILSDLVSLGFSPLPAILWRKQTNAPNKFMGSGMLPAGAYVTLEHEYILICRKGAKRSFNTGEEKRNRQESAVFWEERNQWFSDVWMDLKGTRQGLGGKEARQRSAAFPFELAYRLVLMYSVRDDTVLDPFMGTGTTMAAAMAAGRSSVGVEFDKTLAPAVQGTLAGAAAMANRRVAARLDAHLAFVRQRIEAGKPPRHTHSRYGFPVVTRQEQHLRLQPLVETRNEEDGGVRAVYGPDLSPNGGPWPEPAPSAPQKPWPDSLSGQLKFEFQ